MWWKSLNVQRIVGSRYMRLRYLGNGLNGVVFRALARPANQPVAIKLIRVESKDNTTRKRLAAEIKAMERLDGQFSVNVYEANLESTPPYYVMEFVRWGDLRSRLGRHLSDTRLIFLFQSICHCVEACHSMEITHRDLKPENILFRSPSRLVLADFGICKLDAAIIGTTRLEMEKRGTPGSLAPEQLRDFIPQSKPADIFALGTMLHFDFAQKLRLPILKDRAEKLAERCRATAAEKRPTIREVMQEIDAMATLVSSLRSQKAKVNRLVAIVECFIVRTASEGPELARTEGLYLRHRMLEFNKLAKGADTYKTSTSWHLEEVPPYYAPHFDSERRDVPLEQQKKNILSEARRFLSHIKRYRGALS